MARKKKKKEVITIHFGEKAEWECYLMRAMLFSETILRGDSATANSILEVMIKDVAVLTTHDAVNAETAAGSAKDYGAAVQMCC